MQRPLLPLAVFAGIAIPLLSLPAPAHALSPEAAKVRCQRALVKGTSTVVRTDALVLQRCADAIARGSLPPDFDCIGDARVDAKRVRARAKLRALLDRACGGLDRQCGTTDDADVFTLAEIGVPPTCVDFEERGCNFALDDCQQLSLCLGCIAAGATEQALGLVHGRRTAASGALLACQRTIAQETIAFLVAKDRILQRCWDMRLKGRHADHCLDHLAPARSPAARAVAKIARAEARKIARICRACGGDDGRCDDAVIPVNPGVPASPGSNGGDDLPANALWVDTTCPEVTIPAQASRPPVACGGAMTTLADLIRCVDCVAEFKVDCVDAARFPALGPYPAECNATPAPGPTRTPTPVPSATPCDPPPPSPVATPSPVGTPPAGCPRTVQLDSDPAALDFDLGWTGIGHDQDGPLMGRVTFAVARCTQPGTPTCGSCELWGPVANAGGAAFDNRRCADAPHVACTSTAECTAAGAAGPCRFFLGPPYPLVADGFGYCTLTPITEIGAGFFGVESGDALFRLRTELRLHTGITIERVCPTCETGVCNSGPRHGQPCTVQGQSTRGAVSLDCPPNPAALVGDQVVTFFASTGTTTRTLSADNPSCRAAGAQTKRCFCDTCNSTGAEACSADFQCPDCKQEPGLTGVCGGRRCLGGSVPGRPCTSNSVCDGGFCNVPGEATDTNACSDRVCTPNPADTDSSDEGVCSAGPEDRFCSLSSHRSCDTDLDCQPPACPSCPPGQTCIIRQRECFTDNGAIGGDVSVTGSADPPVGGVAHPVVGSLFCVAPTHDAGGNTVIGLPGLGRITWHLTATLQ